MQTSHLDRLALYSCKVRYLYLQSFPDSIAAHFVSRLLIEKNFTLFPALKTLYIPSLTPPGFHSPNIDNFNPLFLIQGFSLTTLSIGGITSSTEALVASLLSVLSHRAIAVQDLILSGRLSLDILCFIESFTRLQGLNLTFDSGSVVPSAFIGYCGNLPDLTHLIINLNSATIDNSSLPIRSSVQGFERIQELRLRGDLDEISKILRSISQAPNLKTIIIGCMALLPNPVTVSLSIEAYIQDLARIAPSLQFLDANMGAGKTIVLPGGALRPLIQCRDLVRLEIAGVLLSITDDHIGELCAGDNWRNLRTLILPSSVDGKSPSLSSLQIFARNCPSLVNLTLPVDFRLHTPQTLKEERLRASRCSNAIEYLSIHKITTTRHDNETNTVAMGIAVSRFIEYCLPCLKVVTLNSESPAFDADWWRTVKTMIAEFRTVRHEAVSESLRSLSWYPTSLPFSAALRHRGLYHSNNSNLSIE